MSLTKLPNGSYIDPEYNHVGGMFKQPPSPAQNINGWAIIMLTTMCQYVIPCADEAEADAQLGALAVRLGYADALDAKATAELRSKQH